MKRLRKYMIFCIIAHLFFACSTSVKEENHSISFLNIPSGQAAISKDKTEDYFHRIQLRDIRLQLKKDITVPLPIARELYQDALKESVLEFTKKDKERLNQIFNEIEKKIKKINSHILSEKIQLIKVNPYLYGEDVFYTRDDAIIIPANMLEEFDREIMEKIMIHEIFHIYSRHKKQSKRVALYGLIHFRKIDEKLIIPETIRQRVLLNPDGLEMTWYIESKVESKQLRLIPLLIALENKQESDIYFDNLELRFYPVFEEGKDIQIKEGIYYGESELTDFYDQVTDNTNYIIHPDEILAENFVLAVLSQDNPAVLEELSLEGRELVGKLLELLEKTD